MILRAAKGLATTDLWWLCPAGTLRRQYQTDFQGCFDCEMGLLPLVVSAARLRASYIGIDSETNKLAQWV
jgi:hypothetical protein